MLDEKPATIPAPEDEHQIIEPVEFDFGLRRRTFVQLVATGLMIAVAPFPSTRNRLAGGAVAGAVVVARAMSGSEFTSARTA